MQTYSRSGRGRWGSLVCWWAALLLLPMVQCGGGDGGKTHLSLLQGFNLEERHAELTPSSHPQECPAHPAQKTPLCHRRVHEHCLPAKTGAFTHNKNVKTMWRLPWFMRGSACHKGSTFGDSLCLLGMLAGGGCSWRRRVKRVIFHR